MGMIGLGVWPVKTRGAEDTEMDRLSRIFREYDKQGFHRTGTNTDIQSAHWLADMIRDAGQKPVLVGFPHQRVDPVHCALYLDKKRIPAVPCFDGAFTDAKSIEGRIGTLEDKRTIAVIPSWQLETDPFNTARAGNLFKGIVVVSDATAFGIHPGLVLLNADNFTAPFNIPAIQISSHEKTRIMTAANEGQSVRLIAEVKRTPVDAINVEVHVEGKQPELAPIVVMTPRSGWWHCASERGGGIAVWLEMIRELSRNKPNRNVIFIASTGHELGHLGLDHFLDHNGRLIKQARIWIHLGANFAAAAPAKVRIQASEKAVEDLAVNAMAGAGISPDIKSPVGARPAGEARNIFDGGGRYISLLGSNSYFHHVDDRWPKAVDLSKTRRLADAFTTILVQQAS